MKSAPEPDTVIDNLNELLRGELSAVETYTQAISHIKDHPISTLTINRDSHVRRVQLLREKIMSLRGDPDKSSGLWGSFAKLVEKSAAMISEKTLINALEEGEDRGLATYRKPGNVDPITGAFIQTELLPDQLQSHERMRQYQKAFQ